MRRILCALSLSCLLLGTVGCGRSGDVTTNMSKEEQAAKAKEMAEKQKEGMKKAMQGAGQAVPEAGGDGK